MKLDMAEKRKKKDVLPPKHKLTEATAKPPSKQVQERIRQLQKEYEELGGAPY